MKIKKYLFVIIMAISVLFTAYMGYEYMRYKKYTSSRIESNLPFIFQGIDRYFDRYITVPNPKELYQDLINDSELKARYPKVYEMLPELNMEDFIFTEKPLLTVEVWMFSDKSKTKDTILLNNVSFFDFLFRKSIYITTVGLVDVCGSNPYILLNKNNKRIEDSIMQGNFSKTRFKMQKELLQSDIYDAVRWNCYYMYNDNKHLIVEKAFSTDAVPEPIVKNLMLNHFTPLFEKYIPKYEKLRLYIHIY